MRAHPASPRQNIRLSRYDRRTDVRGRWRSRCWCTDSRHTTAQPLCGRTVRSAYCRAAVHATRHAPPAPCGGLPGGPDHARARAADGHRAPHRRTSRALRRQPPGRCLRRPGYAGAPGGARGRVLTDCAPPSGPSGCCCCCGCSSADCCGSGRTPSPGGPRRVGRCGVRVRVQPPVRSGAVAEAPAGGVAVAGLAVS